ncbi:hypothetical protein I8J29_06270 [Paenibacillus sp. MWE-103]|uniref:Uncharacterized protein n=1 Tax=Paenibacillus artemisiicola TaxID=1172618 RepID=A0ABS3W681_9BACL|nr:hypothetical protein [Paenibacillus artemisiicola]MBO7743793.1 hypothetical protein [Paenibacillus artemisiicola]
MKKILASSLIATAVLVVSGSAFALANNSNTGIMISKQEYERMSKIIIGVNKGQLPVSALKAAEPLLQKRPDLVSRQTLEKYKAIQ